MNGKGFFVCLRFTGRLSFARLFDDHDVQCHIVHSAMRHDEVQIWRPLATLKQVRPHRPLLAEWTYPYPGDNYSLSLSLSLSPSLSLSLSSVVLLGAIRTRFIRIALCVCIHFSGCCQQLSSYALRAHCSEPLKVFVGAFSQPQHSQATSCSVLARKPS